jgi:ubiquinol-cytochrome c reductase cytochrome c1 subunit
MVRFLGFLVGLGFVAVAAWSFLWGVIAYFGDPPQTTVEHRFHEEPRDVSYSFDGVFGRYDRQQLQRGFQVFKEVCASCHSLNLVAFRNLHDLGYTEAEVRAIADQWQNPIPSVNPNTGEAATRKAIPADRILGPYLNETQARLANNNALPPDLSLMVKAREGGTRYIYSLITGYQDPPAELPAENRPGTGLHYNPYFANLNVAMPPPLTADGQVTYAEGNPAPTRDQMARDVSAFLTWAAEPELEQRRAGGLTVLAFLILASILAYLAYQNVMVTTKRKARIDAGVEG